MEAQSNRPPGTSETEVVVRRITRGTFPVCIELVDAGVIAAAAQAAVATD